LKCVASYFCVSLSLSSFSFRASLLFFSPRIFVILEARSASLMNAQCVVIDVGSDTTKAGFGGDDSPISVFPSAVCRLYEDGKAEVLVGDSALGLEKVKVNRPIEWGIVTNFPDLELVYGHAYEQLEVEPSEHSVLVTESMPGPKANREKLTQMMFESFGVPSMYLACQAVLTLYAYGKTTGTSVECNNVCCD
jgi:actin